MREAHYSDGSKLQQGEVEAWDFNRDGTPEYVRFVNPSTGEVEEAYDFDFDGRPEVYKSNRPSVDVPAHP